MIPNTMVEEVRRLLAEGKLSQRRIAITTGLSRGTVTSIALNRRNERPPSLEAEIDFGPPARCPACGGMVYLPCRLCLVRDLKHGVLRERRNQPRSAWPERGPDSVRQVEGDRQQGRDRHRSTESRRACESLHDRAKRLPGR